MSYPIDPDDPISMLTGGVLESMTIEKLAAKFVADELRAIEKGNEDPMPWRILRSSLIRFARYHEVDKGKPGRVNDALRAALKEAGYNPIPPLSDHAYNKNMDTYPVALCVGSWPEFVGEIDRLMAEEGRAS